MAPKQKTQTKPFSDVPTHLKELATADLARSGLTLDDADQLGIGIVPADTVASLGHSVSGSALLFAYYDPFEGTFQDIHQFHRIRFLEYSASVGFGAQVQQPRYSQPKGTLNSVYVPRIVEGHPFDWNTFLSNPSNDLCITEGEKKAAAACKAGVPTIGLGGVDVYQAKNKGAAMLPMLAKINFKGRNVNVIFDTDTPAGLKPEVLRSATRLLDWLLLQGARPYLITLPTDGDKKVGLDDYFLVHNKLDFTGLKLSNSLVHVDATTIASAAAEYRYIVDIDRFVGDNPHLLMQPQHLDRVLGMKQVTLPRLERAKDMQGMATTKLVPKPVTLADALLIWPGTERFQSMVYEPGKGRMIERDGLMYLNLWQGWRCEYIGTDRLPSAALQDKIMSEWWWAVDNVFADDADARQFVEHWLLYPLKYPGAKFNTFALLCSREEGIGKSFIGHMLAKYLYGLTNPGARHAWQLAEGDLAGQFNPFLFATSFVEGDDIAAHDKKAVYERVKSFVTSDTVQINIKNTPQFMMDNRANFWLTTNDAAPFYLHEMSRRAFIHTPKKAKKNQERYHALDLMFADGTAGPTLLHYAREKYDEKKFIPGCDAPMTQGKVELAMNARTGAREWLHDLVVHYDMLTRPFATIREIAALMEMENVIGKFSVDAIGHQLREAGAERWHNGGQINVPNSNGGFRKERVWMFGDFSRLAAMDSLEIAKEMRTEFGYQKSTKVVPITAASKKYVTK